MSDNIRDELIELIQDVGEYIPGSHADDYISPTKAADAILARFDVTEKPREKSYDEHLDEWEARIADRAMSYEGFPREEAEADARAFIDQYRRPKKESA